MATNCSVVPFAMLGAAGVTAMDDSVAAVTVSGVVPETPLKFAVMVTGPPTPTAVARPEVLSVATAVFEELQVTVDVMFWVVWLE